ncbi:MAG: PH domain-containing protein [Eggerthellaceae bacterium]|nr:PH domain-containing protein [Eggerthellaceae bacterium]
MSEANPFIATFETGRHYKVHKSYVYVAPIVAVIAVVFVVFVNGLEGLIRLYSAMQRGDISFNPLLAVGLVVLGLAVIIAAFVGLYALAWRNMSYVFDEREFSFYSGIITKRRVHVPYARVQSVNHRASIIQRLFGVCTVTIDSAGGSSNKAVRVPYLQLETAERMRAELFMRKAAVGVGAEAAIAYLPQADTATAEGMQAHRDRVQAELSQAPVPPGQASALPASWACPKCGTSNTAKFCGKCGAPQPAQATPNILDTAAAPLGDWRGLYGGTAMLGEEPASYEHGLTNHELLLTSISHDMPHIVALIVCFTFVLTLGLVLLVQDEVALTIALYAIPIILGATLVTWIIALAGIMFSYGNFRARRRGSRIEVERGLLARNFSGIDIERIQSIEIRQSFVRRIIGYCELSLGRIDTASEKNSGNNDSKMNANGLVVHPFVKLDRVDEIIDGLAPEFADRPRRVDCAPLPKPALRRCLLRRCVWYNWALWAAVVTGVCWAIIGALVTAGNIHFASAASYAQYDRFMVGSLVFIIALCVVITVAKGIGAVLWARHSGYTWNRRYLLLHNDGLSTGQSIVPRQKIQAGAMRSNPFQRRLSLATLQAVTAAGTHATTARLVDGPADVGFAYLDWVKPRRVESLKDSAPV